MDSDITCLDTRMVFSANVGTGETSFPSRKHLLGSGLAAAVMLEVKPDSDPDGTRRPSLHLQADERVEDTGMEECLSLELEATAVTT